MHNAFRIYVENFVANLGGSHWTANAVLIIATILIAIVLYYIAQSLLKLASHVVLRSRSTWDDDLLNNRMFSAVAHLAPAVVSQWALTAFFTKDTGAIPLWVTLSTTFYMVWTLVRIFLIFLSNLYAAMAKRDETRDYAIKGVFQMLKLVAIGVAILIIVSKLFGKEPTAILATLGASAAVISLVFKDTILGLVAGVQLTANKMIHRGDWIECEKHNINGMVTDISLTTIKVRNWDNTISTIPPYTLITDSFRNYQAMFESGGRRVCRCIYIDVNTVHICSPDELAELEKGGYLEGLEFDRSKVVNLQLLRYYLEHFLATDPRVNTSMCCMVRQLEPTPKGIPLQLYFFTKRTEWVKHETDQADIFDFVYAMVNKFGIAIFQSPAGTDITRRLE